MSAAHQAAFITPQVIRWARERAQMKLDRVAKVFHTSQGLVTSWETGKSALTLRQAQRLAELFHVPFGYLFLPSPPVEKIPLPDFRTAKGPTNRKPSAGLIDLLNDVIVKQQWYRDFLLEQGSGPLEFVGRFSVRDDSDRIAQSICATLGIDNNLRQRSKTWEEFLRAIIRNAENAGILIMRSGVAAGNPHRPLSVKEFRGFAISDPIAPLIFVNGRDSQTAQIFTITHELVHIWIGKSGISNENLTELSLDADNYIERFCNQTAAEILLPQSEFLSQWSASRSIKENMEGVARHFRVSTVVVLRRAFDLHLMNWRQYTKFYKRELQSFVKRTEERRTGGHSIRNIITRNSAKLTGAVVRGALEGQVLYRDAARLLNVNTPVIQKIATYMAKPKEGT